MKVLSIEQMTKLKELGVDTSKASVRVGKMEFKHGDPWYGKEEYDVFLFDNEDNDTQCIVESYRAFNLQDVIELLPIENIDIRRNCHERWVISYKDEITFKSEFMIDAAYLMLIWVIENGHLKTK